MYRLLRNSLAPNKTYLPTSRQLILPTSRQLSLPYTTSSGIKGKASDKLGYPFLLPSSRQSYTTSTIKGEVSDKLDYFSATKDTDQVSDKLDEFLENCVYKNKRSTFKLLREDEKKNFSRYLLFRLA